MEEPDLGAGTGIATPPTSIVSAAVNRSRPLIARPNGPATNVRWTSISRPSGATTHTPLPKRAVKFGRGSR